MLLVPEQTHELAINQGFRVMQVGRPMACCICDAAVPTFGWGYQLHQDGHLYDLWCIRCIEEKLPKMLAEQKALR